jgi:hypothetical protein
MQSERKGRRKIVRKNSGESERKERVEEEKIIT